MSQNSIVLDLGANHGSFSAFMAHNFGCRCIAVEANPSIFNTIEPHPLVTLKNVAVAGTSGMLPFHIFPNRDEASSLLKPVNGAGVETVMVPALTLRELLQESDLARVDLIKMDIEGAEIEVLEECTDELLCDIPQITVEFHDFNGLISRSAAIHVVERLRGLGFDVFQMWMRSHGDTLFVNRRLGRINMADRIWSRRVVRNWWWTKRFIKRKLQLSN